MKHQRRVWVALALLLTLSLSPIQQALAGMTLASATAGGRQDSAMVNQWLVFIDADEGTLYKQRADGSDRTVIAQKVNDILPCGDNILFYGVQGKDKNSKWYSMDVDKDKITASASSYTPIWWDGKKVWAVSDKKKLYTMNSDGKGAKQELEFTGDAIGFVEGAFLTLDTNAKTVLAWQNGKSTPYAESVTGKKAVIIGGSLFIVVSNGLYLCKDGKLTRALSGTVRSLSRYGDWAAVGCEGPGGLKKSGMEIWLIGKDGKAKVGTTSKGVYSQVRLLPSAVEFAADSGGLKTVKLPDRSSLRSVTAN